MSVKGIVIVNASADRHYSQRALHSLENFNANLTTQDFDTLERNQKAMSEELRERFKRAAEEDGNDINYTLYARDDDKKSPSMLDERVSILNPTLSRIKASGRLSSPAECRTCANRKASGGSRNKAAPLQTSLPLAPTINAEIVLGTGRSPDENSFDQYVEERDWYGWTTDELKEYEESRDEDGNPTIPKPPAHYLHRTHISHVTQHHSANRSLAVSHAHEHRAAAVENVSAQLRVDICPECGRAYISGTVANSNVQFFSNLDEANPYHQQLLDEGKADFRGNNVELDA